MLYILKWSIYDVPTVKYLLQKNSVSAAEAVCVELTFVIMCCRAADYAS